MNAIRTVLKYILLPAQKLADWFAVPLDNIVYRAEIVYPAHLTGGNEEMEEMLIARTYHLLQRMHGTLLDFHRCCVTVKNVDNPLLRLTCPWGMSEHIGKLLTREMLSAIESVFEHRSDLWLRMELKEKRKRQR